MSPEWFGGQKGPMPDSVFLMGLLLAAAPYAALLGVLGFVVEYLEERDRK